MKIPISQHVAESSVVVVSQLSAAVGMWAAQVPGGHRMSADAADGVPGGAVLRCNIDIAISMSHFAFYVVIRPIVHDPPWLVFPAKGSRQF